MPIEFDHITVPSRNLDASIHFYESLGMSLIEHEPQHHAHFENQEHAVIFTAYYNKTRPDYEVKVYFEVEDLKTVEVRFREIYKETSKCLHPQSNPKTIWDGKELHLSDPDGNQVILYEKLLATSVPPWQKDTLAGDKNNRSEN